MHGVTAQTALTRSCHGTPVVGLVPLIVQNMRGRQHPEQSTLHAVDAPPRGGDPEHQHQQSQYEQSSAHRGQGCNNWSTDPLHYSWHSRNACPPSSQAANNSVSGPTIDRQTLTDPDGNSSARALTRHWHQKPTNTFECLNHTHAQSLVHTWRGRPNTHLDRTTEFLPECNYCSSSKHVSGVRVILCAVS